MSHLILLYVYLATPYSFYIWFQYVRRATSRVSSIVKRLEVRIGLVYIPHRLDSYFRSDGSLPPGVR